MRVQDVMTEDVQTISPGNAAEDAWELMRTHSFHHLVVTHGSRVLGVLSDRDVGGRLGSTIRRGHTVAELMTPQSGASVWMTETGGSMTRVPPPKRKES